MAFEQSLTMVSSSSQILKEEDEEENDDDGFHQIRNSLSRLSVCTSSKNHQDLAVLTSESFDGDEADGEVSDEDKGEEAMRTENVGESDSDKETPGFYSLPVTPSRRRRKLKVSGELDGSKCKLRRRRRVMREKKKRGVNGESNGGGGEDLTVLTRAKEMKACRDLGFELNVPGRISVSTGSNFDTQTSSGGNSPIATWRISSPGDDPKEVKARLKVWAQAVALASASRQF